MEIKPTEFDGVFEVWGPLFEDDRGSFSKPYHQRVYEEAGINCSWAESFWTRSRRAVVRGMHFQVPPHDHAKLVTCISGAIFDAVVDLRRGSRTYGRVLTRELRPESGLSLYIASGCAHGFMATSDDAVVLYHVNSMHSPAHDGGIRWDTCGIAWPTVSDAIVSERDAGFPAFVDFESPFGA